MEVSLNTSRNLSKDRNMLKKHFTSNKSHREQLHVKIEGGHPSHGHLGEGDEKENDDDDDDHDDDEKEEKDEKEEEKVPPKILKLQLFAFWFIYSLHTQHILSPDIIHLILPLIQNPLFISSFFASNIKKKYMSFLHYQQFPFIRQYYHTSTTILPHHSLS